MCIVVEYKDIRISTYSLVERVTTPFFFRIYRKSLHSKEDSRTKRLSSQNKEENVI